MGLSMWQIALVVLVFVLLFGRGKIPALMTDLAQGIKSFKKGIQDNEPASSETGLDANSYDNRSEGPSNPRYSEK